MHVPANVWMPPRVQDIVCVCVHMHCVCHAVFCSLVPSLHCQLFFVCWKKRFFFQHAGKKLAVETGYEASILYKVVCAYTATAKHLCRLRNAIEKLASFHRNTESRSKVRVLTCGSVKKGCVNYLLCSHALVHPGYIDDMKTTVTVN